MNFKHSDERTGLKGHTIIYYTIIQHFKLKSYLCHNKKK